MHPPFNMPRIEKGKNPIANANANANRNLNPNARKDYYKKPLPAEGARRKREDTLVQIRKEKRAENLQKRRKEVPPLVPATKSDHQESQEESIKKIASMALLLSSRDDNKKEKAVAFFRKILSDTNCKDYIDKVIEANIVPLLLQLLTRKDAPKLQYEAAWALTNIVWGTTAQTKVVVDNGGLPLFIDLLSSPDEYVVEQAVWALGNMAGDSVCFRDAVLESNALIPILRVFTNKHRTSTVRNATWALSNLCRGKPSPKHSQVKDALPVLKWLVETEDADVIADACWALAFLSEGSSFEIQAILSAEICPRVVQLLSHPSETVIIPALRIVGNIVSDDNENHTQAILDQEALPPLIQLTFEGYRKSIMREALWSISNITAGNNMQIQAVIDAGAFPQLIDILKGADFQLRKDATWAITNATCSRVPSQIQHIATEGAIQGLCEMLECSDPRITMVCLEGLENILIVGQKERDATMPNIYVKMIEDAGGLAKIHELQAHNNSQIYEKATSLLASYFGEEHAGADDLLQ